MKSSASGLGQEGAKMQSMQQFSLISAVRLHTFNLTSHPTSPLPEYYLYLWVRTQIGSQQLANSEVLDSPASNPVHIWYSVNYKDQFGVPWRPTTNGNVNIIFKIMQLVSLFKKTCCICFSAWWGSDICKAVELMDLIFVHKFKSQ